MTKTDKLNKKIEWIELLQSKNLKATTPRLAIIKALLKTKKPVTIDELTNLLGNNHQFPISTFYRSLKKLTDVGIVYKTYFNGVAAYYELQTNHHHHVTCVECGLQSTVDCDRPIDEEIFSKSVPSNFTAINYHVLEYFGICKKCA
jgi:Fe2+ or Zn2+ uptake regulation protein